MAERSKRAMGEESRCGGESAFDVLERILDPKRRRKKLRPREFQALGKGMTEDESKRLIERPVEDPKLTHTKRLVTIVARACREGGGGNVHRDVLAVMRRLMEASEALRPWIRETAPADEPERAIVERTLTAFRLNDGSAELRLNVAWCVLAWLAIADTLCAEAALRFARRHIWPLDDAGEASLELLGVLVGTGSGKLLLMKISALEGELRAEKDEVGRGQRLLREAGRQLQEKAAENQRGSEKLAEAEDNVRRLAMTMRDLQDESAHRHANSQRLIGFLLRRLRADKDLLLDGLHALNQKTPRVHVMVDHGERVVDSMVAAIDRIERDR